jgi:hypothetical protein
MRKVGSEQIEWQGRHWIKGYIKIGYIDAEDLTLTPTDGYVHVYAKDAGTSKLYWKDDAGVEHEVAGASSIVTDHGALTGLADDDHTQYVLRSILTTNGDLFVRAAGAVSRLGVGSNGQVLTVSSGAPAWAAPATQTGSAWSVLTNGDPVTPELMWDSNGDVIMTETLR